MQHYLRCTSESKGAEIYGCWKTKYKSRCTHSVCVVWRGGSARFTHTQYGRAACVPNNCCVVAGGFISVIASTTPQITRGTACFEMNKRAYFRIIERTNQTKVSLLALGIKRSGALPPSSLFFLPSVRIVLTNAAKSGFALKPSPLISSPFFLQKTLHIGEQRAAYAQAI